MEGIAYMYAKATGKHYYMGLWLENLPRDLLWFSWNKIKRPAELNFPSWSWASTTGQITSLNYDSVARACADVIVDSSVQGQLLVTGRIKAANISNIAGKRPRRSEPYY
jgi:hypothetical protein